MYCAGELSDALRSSQEQQQQQQQLVAALAASGNRANAAAVYQLFQKYSQDPAMLQRHMITLASPKDQELARMMDASSLIYHFARRLYALLLLSLYKLVWLFICFCQNSLRLLSVAVALISSAIIWVNSDSYKIVTNSDTN